MSMYNQEHPILLPEERVLADKAYVGRAGRRLGLMTPFKRQNGLPTRYQTAFNKVHLRKRIVARDWVFEKIQGSFGTLQG
jgi:hypothetical protein